MAVPPVPSGAVEASLLFAVGRSRPPAPTVRLSPELSSGVSEMLGTQGSPELIPEALDAVRAARAALDHDSTLTISAQRYERVRSEFLDAHGIRSGKGMNIWPVGRTTILKRAGGSWSEALRSAGLAVTTGPQATGFGAAKFTQEQFATAVRDFTKDAAARGASTSYQNYVDWRKRQRDAGRTDLPSGPSLRNTYGSWSSALSEAASRK